MKQICGVRLAGSSMRSKPLIAENHKNERGGSGLLARINSNVNRYQVGHTNKIKTAYNSSPHNPIIRQSCDRVIRGQTLPSITLLIVELGENPWRLFNFSSQQLWLRSNRIEDLEKRELIEIGISSVDSAYAMLAHENRRVRIVH
jgi:hypothetical protein